MKRGEKPEREKKKTRKEDYIMNNCRLKVDYIRPSILTYHMIVSIY